MYGAVGCPQFLAPSQFAARIEPAINWPEATVPLVLLPIVRWRYGAHQPVVADVRLLAALRTALEVRLKAELPTWTYLVRRILQKR